MARFLRETLVNTAARDYFVLTKTPHVLKTGVKLYHLHLLGIHFIHVYNRNSLLVLVRSAFSARQSAVLG